MHQSVIIVQTPNSAMHLLHVMHGTEMYFVLKKPSKYDQMRMQAHGGAPRRR